MSDPLSEKSTLLLSLACLATQLAHEGAANVSVNVISILSKAAPRLTIVLELLASIGVVTVGIYSIWNSIRKWYTIRGIPYRRGYLFYGPPSTGKTSFCETLAGHSKLDLFVTKLSLDSLTEGIFEWLFDSLPEKYIIVLEDINSTGITRDTMRNDKKGKSGISLSALRNIVDGSTSAEEGLLIVTSNTPGSLDPALVRGGRIDRKILF